MKFDGVLRNRKPRRFLYFTLPGLRSRPEDIEPNLQFELDEFARRTGHHITFNKEAREKFLGFALTPSSQWAGNFRDLNAAVVRMATLAQGGRISLEIVDEEIERLSASWARFESDESDELLSQILSTEVLEQLDQFDRVQLAHVVQVCRSSRSLSNAGRRLFNASRTRKASTNDADRLRKYLSRFGVTWSQVIGEESSQLA
jgi:transcriptional regulatory protein RtcR